MATHNEVAQAWLNGKAKNGSKTFDGQLRMHTDGQFLMSYRMIIGRTLDDGTKQLLDVSGVHSYSVSTAKHVRVAFRAGNYKLESLSPVYSETNVNQPEGHWRYFQPNGSTALIRATSQLWKTERGAKNALERAEKYMDDTEKGKVFVYEVWSGFTLGFYQTTDAQGHKV